MSVALFVPQFSLLLSLFHQLMLWKVYPGYVHPRTQGLLLPQFLVWGYSFTQNDQVSAVSHSSQYPCCRASISYRFHTWQRGLGLLSPTQYSLIGYKLYSRYRRLIRLALITCAPACSNAEISCRERQA